jgi:hypothetical protein
MKNQTASTAASGAVYVPHAAPVSALRLKRLTSGVTMTALAVESGFSPWLLSVVERGVRPLTPAEMKRIAAALARIVARGRS